MLHDPYANATPSQIKYATARHNRLEKIAAQARPEVVAVAVPPEVVKEPAFDFNAWIELQARLNPIPKPLWFGIKEDLGPLESLKPKIDDIQRVVCKYYEITRTELLANRRMAYLVRARHVGIYLAKKLTDRSLPEIGRRFGGRDHTTILHSVRKIENILRQTNEKLEAEIRHLTVMLGAVG